jgi:16S rRNA (cytidine1402-2'-O)-methyltransferase
MLYVVATPIGNLGDITLRARETLAQVSVVAAEDTRRARSLLSHLGISGKRFLCVDAHASVGVLEKLAQKLSEGERVALLTDAGTPSVSDPGCALVRLCRERNIPVTPIPGPSAVTTAIAASGLVDGAFLFLGFLPRKGEKRQKALQRIRRTAEAVVLFESPNRTHALLKDLAQEMPERLLCVARELTKKFEEVRVKPLREWAEFEAEVRGEVTLVLAPAADAPAEESGARDVRELMADLLERGMSAKDASAHLALATGTSKRDLYQLALEHRATGQKTE